MKVIMLVEKALFVTFFITAPLLLGVETHTFGLESVEVASLNPALMKSNDKLLDEVRKEEPAEDVRVYGLIENLKSEDVAVKLDAAQALGQMKGTRPVTALVDLLRESDLEVVRFVAATSLGEIGDRRAVIPLMEAMRESRTRPTVLIAAAKALGKIGDHQGVKPIMEHLGHENPDVRVGMADALGKMNDRRAVMALIATLGDENPSVRLSAARALGEVGDTLAVEPLILVFKNDRVSDVRWWAAHALGELADARAMGSLMEIIKIRSPEEIAPMDDVLELRQLEPSGGARMMGFIKGMQWSIQVEAIRSLGKMGEEALPSLTSILLRHPEFDFRTEAAKMIIDIRGTRYMIDLVNDEDALLFVKTLYGHVISKGEPGTEDVLIKALETYGEIHMARDFLGSENQKLLKAATDWMYSKGYDLPAKEPKGGPRWGERI